ncbi:DUF4097 domain-containing protein [Christensenellaceae bacterium OttesenSCG-928-K19]|nr:DUF4097 domain-containing protein [Christensenellaceae bacterium OttesenSCG-928-K19]
MNKIKMGALLVGVMLFMVTLTSCGEKQEMKLVNEQTFTPSEVSSIRIDYDSDDITLLESATADIVLKEYMDIDKGTYYARIENKNGELSISEGQRPSGNRLDCYVELYLPAGYEADVAVHTTESTLKTQIGHSLAALRTDTTHGTLEITGIKARTVSVSSANGAAAISNVEADTISFNTTNAAVNADNVHGAIQYTTSNGKLILTAAYGSGTFEATSDGTIDITFTEITGDVKATAKNNDILFTAPEDTAFHFVASSRNGSIDASYDGVAVSNGQATGDVGDNPHFTVELDARNGNIEAK